MPGLKTIDGFKGTIDYYVHDGQPCVRKWPRSPGHRRAPAVEAQWTAFTYAAKIWASVSPYVRRAYARMGHPPMKRDMDWFMRAYLRGIDYGEES